MAYNDDRTGNVIDIYSTSNSRTDTLATWPCFSKITCNYKSNALATRLTPQKLNYTRHWTQHDGPSPANIVPVFLNLDDTWSYDTDTLATWPVIILLQLSRHSGNVSGFSPNHLQLQVQRTGNALDNIKPNFTGAGPNPWLQCSKSNLSWWFFTWIVQTLCTLVVTQHTIISWEFNTYCPPATIYPRLQLQCQQDQTTAARDIHVCPKLSWP